MKRSIAVASVLAAAVAAVQAQPAPTTPPADQGSGSGSGSGSAGSGSGSAPDWLPGVQDVTAAEMATPGKVTLSMARAVELAKRQHPNVRAARATADVAYGRVEQAKVVEHPTLTLAGTLGASSKNGSLNTKNDTFTPPGFFTVQESTGLSATASWRIYDFGQTKANVRAAEATADAQDASIGTTELDTAQAVELAYLESVARRRLVIVAQATVKSDEAHLDQAQRFVAAQAHDPIEVAQAQATLANARSALAQAESSEAIALANLRAAIGWIDPTRAPAVDPSWPTPTETNPAPLPELVDTAQKHRPEILALQKDIEASQFSLDAAKDERRPVLSATASSLWGPTSQQSWTIYQPTWQAGITLSWQAWDGGKSYADQHVARANLQVSIAQRDELLVTLTSSLESAASQINTNRAAVEAANEGVTAAQAELHLAEARYAQGLGSQIELADAQTAVTTAEGNLVQAEWQLADAWVSLNRQLGVDL